MILVVGAIGQELAGARDRARLLICGVGPVEAAIATAKEIVRERPRAILNVGLAGARHGAGIDLLDVVVGSEAVYCDLFPRFSVNRLFPDPGLLTAAREALPEARFLPVVSAQDMLTAVESVVDNADIFIGVAAVADYYVLNPSEQKIKKDAHILTLELAPNPDILASISSRPKPPFCVGFAAESENLEEYAELKRRRKHLPLIVANDVKEAVGADDVQLILLDEAGRHVLEKADKRTQARRLVAHIAELYNTHYQ